MLRFYSKDKDGARATLLGFHENGRLRISASRCSKCDSFSKKKGIERAKYRADRGKFIYDQEVSSDFSPKDFIEIAVILSEVVLNTKAVAPR